MKVRQLLWLLVAGVVLAVPGAGQDSDEYPGGETVFGQILSFYSPLILPKVFQDVHRLRMYIRGEAFADIRARYGDLVSVDSIYLKARELAWGNLYEALLISTIATMNHRNFGIRFDPFGSLLWLPLTSEFPEEFRQRVQNLPGRLYPDTPVFPGSDRDKLQHFFGSAFLAYSFESRGSAERVGDMVELGEQAFIEGGQYDDRDRRANLHGQSFGYTLLRDRTVVPSMFLSLVTAVRLGDRGSDPVGGHCVPLNQPDGVRPEAR